MRALFTPFPDESLYSIIIRYSLLNGISSLYSLKNNLIKIDKNNSYTKTHDTILLIRKISKLTGTPLDYLINNHTLMNLYRPFSYVNCQQSSIRFINDAFNIKDIHTLKLCRECYKDDIKKQGVAYWHRSHSVPLVNYCHIHKAPLKRRWYIDWPGTGKFVMPDIEKIELDFVDRLYTKRTAIKVAESCHALLNSNSNLIGIEELLSWYVYDLESKGIIKNLQEFICINNKNKDMSKLIHGYRINHHELSSLKLLDKFIIFLCAKKNNAMNIIDFLNFHIDTIYRSYSTFDNMFNLCRSFINRSYSKKYLKQVREIRKLYSTRKAPTQYNVNNIFEIW